jgi:hypothetical protein
VSRYVSTLLHRPQAFTATGVWTVCGKSVALERVTPLLDAITCRPCASGLGRRAAKAGMAALAALGLSCAHVRVEPGDLIEVRTLGAVEVLAAPEVVAVKGAGISSAMARLVAAIASFLP